MQHLNLNLKLHIRIIQIIQKLAGTALLMVALFSATTANAQQYLATLSGQVSDTSDARIANATVTATDSITKFATKAVTNGSGGYSIPFLAPGNYTITVENAGFRT